MTKVSERKCPPVSGGPVGKLQVAVMRKGRGLNFLFFLFQLSNRLVFARVLINPLGDLNGALKRRGER